MAAIESDKLPSWLLLEKWHFSHNKFHFAIYRPLYHRKYSASIKLPTSSAARAHNQIDDGGPQMMMNNDEDEEAMSADIW